MSYEFAEKCYESPLTGTKLKEYGLWALVNGAYECRDQRAWQRGVRAMPKINNVVKYLRDKVQNESDPIKKEEAQIQEISLLFALGKYDEVKERYLTMTPQRFNSALARLNRKRVLVPGWRNYYFHWIKYAPAIKAFTGKYGKELRDAEDDFIAGKRALALKKLETIIKLKDLPENNRQYMLYLYGHWMLNITPAISRTSISIIEPWQLEWWQKRPPEVLSRLMQLGIDPATRGRNTNVLHCAIYRNVDTEIIKESLRSTSKEKVAKLTTRQGKKRTGRWTLLHAAAEVCKDPKIIQMLLDCGIDIDVATSEHGNTPLYIALWNNNPPAAKYLIAHGADLRFKSKLGRTMLHAAAKCPDSEFINLMIKNGLKVDAQDTESGKTPLMQACESGHIDAVRLLVKNGAKVNLHENKGGEFTALHYAVKSKKTELVKLLLSSNADTTLKDKSGLTAQDLAQKQGLGYLFEPNK